MSNVVAFLERMGRDAQLRYASQEEVAHALEESEIDSMLGAAVIARSTSDLYALLDLRPMFHVQMNPGEEEQEEEGEEEPDEEAPSQRNALRPLFRSKRDTVLS